MNYVRIEKDKDVAIVWLDQPGEKINKISTNFLDEFDNLVDILEKDDQVKGIVLISGKKDTFIAGADLDKFLKISEPGIAEALSRRGNQLLNRIAQFPKPIVAAIHGAALGGGLEVALACHYRLATDDPKTVFALPEIKLGLLPGGGGTQRLPRLIGLQRALNLMLTGRNVYPRQARKLGLVDELIHPYGLLNAAMAVARRLATRPCQRKRKITLLERVLEVTPPGRKIIYTKAREMVQKQTHGNYPAPFKIIECVETGMEKGLAAGQAAESKKFDELMVTPQCKNLIRLFFNMNAAKKNLLKKKAHPVKKIGILGAGLMGAGIAHVSAMNGMAVQLKDVSYDAIGKGIRTIWVDLDRRVKKRILTSFERDLIMSRISGVVDYCGFKSADLVIEAVFEDLNLKRNVLKEIEEATGKECIFASNTSSIPICEIAARATRPEQVIGMHYFSPVPRMPLLEIIITEKTAQWVTATAMEVGIRQGKTVIVVNDGPGFYTTRILAPFLNEALLLLEEGGDILEINRAMRHFGFPVGPLKLLDEVGIDVGAYVTRVLSGLFKKRGLQSSTITETLFNAGYRGRKNKKGFYKYDGKKSGLLGLRKKKKPEVNPAIYQFFGGKHRRHISPKEIQERLSLVMINEAAHCLQDGILQSPRDGDLGAILGLGFPPFLGGPFRYMDTLGLPKLLQMLQGYRNQHDARFSPAPILEGMAKKNRLFYKD